MKIVVIGSTGRVGHLLVEKLVSKKFEVVTASRHDTSDFDSNLIKHVIIDLTSDREAIAEAMPSDADAIIFVSGSGGKNLLQVDLHGAIKTMQAAESTGVKRYIMLSSIFSLEPKRWSESFLKGITDYNIAKHYSDEWLIHNTQLDYTILQPGALEEKKGSGKITVNVQETGSNAIENVVDALIGVLEQKSTIGKVITMHDGETSIEEALASV